MKSGEADIAVASANHIAQNNASGGPAMRLVGNTGYNYSAFFAEASIKSAADLKGKKIGTGEPGSTPDQLTRLALRKLGIDPDKDVTLVPFDEGRNTDRVKSLLTGAVAAMMITAETMYDLEKSGEIKKLNQAHRSQTTQDLCRRRRRLRDLRGAVKKSPGRRQEIYERYLRRHRARREKIERKPWSLSPRPEGIWTRRGSSIFTSSTSTDVIPAKPFLKPEGVDLAIQMTSALIPSAATMKPQDLIDAALVPELEKEGRCSF